MKKVCMSLFFLLFSGAMVAQDGLFMGLGVGAAFPLGENQQAGVMLNPVSVSLQLGHEGSFLGLTAGFLIASKSQYPVHYQRDTGEKKYVYDYTKGTFSSAPLYEHFTSEKNSLSGVFVLLEYTHPFWENEQYHLGGLVSIGGCGVSFTPKDEGLKDRKDLDKNEKTRMVFALGVQNTFELERHIIQLSLQYFLQNPTLSGVTPSLKGNYFLMRVTFSGRWWS
ncbi:hypothetical protein SAMN05444420_101621 [Capnocytophaga granulosa]|uniref:Outer membrane protein beta-barrel domain-containing protein n=1 Tax=Capnocytophaga granulosa TaxID=45242 RepID=A0A1H2RZV7_9FLAO|nr:hypothetical protein [Capnocytophaga granulosa]EPD30193.1 hypothetical protein HMPREF9331_00834 [Capnocytophaga granulosa ATCC 51502]SDW24971.1 hypothetical protein SAMN05444420_101621 [Capnocytophaga granulosa]SUX20406.1 Uncharacterised protein [Capnocytophaga granulosa]